MNKKWVSEIIDSAIPNNASKNFIEIIKIFLDIMQEKKYSEGGISPIEMITNFDEILNSMDIKELEEVNKLKLPDSSKEILGNYISQFITMSSDYDGARGTFNVSNFYRYLIGDYSIDTIYSDNDVLKKIGIKIKPNLTTLLGDQTTVVPNIYLFKSNGSDLSTVEMILNEIRPLGVLFIIYSNYIISEYNIGNTHEFTHSAMICNEVKMRMDCGDIAFQPNEYTGNLYTLAELSGITYQMAIDKADFYNSFYSCLTWIP